MTRKRNGIFFFGPSGGTGGRAFDADTLAWEAAVISNGGSVSLARRIIVDQFIYDEKASGTWPLTDDYWGFWAENAIQALTSLKQRRLATAVNSPTFTADRDYTTDGTAGYINLNFVPLTDAVAMTTNSVHAEVYERTNVSGVAVAFGGTSGSSRSIAVQTRDGGNVLADGNSSVGTYTLPAADSRGLTQFGRSGTLTTDAYGAKNGVDMTRTVTPSGVGASLPANGPFVGAFNNIGSPAVFKASSYGYASVGAALSGAQRLARYTNVQAWATSVGANV